MAQFIGLDQILGAGKNDKPKTFVGLDEILGTPQPEPTPPQNPHNTPQSTGGSIRQGAASGLQRLANFAADLYKRPGETLERTARIAENFIAPFGGTAPEDVETIRAMNEPRIEQLRAAAAADRPELLRLAEIGRQVNLARPRNLAGRIGYSLAESAVPDPENAVEQATTALLAGPVLKAAGGLGGNALRAFRAARAAERASLEAGKALRFGRTGAGVAPAVESAATGLEAADLPFYRSPTELPQLSAEPYAPRIRAVDEASMGPRPITTQLRAPGLAIEADAPLTAAQRRAAKLNRQLEEEVAIAGALKRPGAPPPTQPKPPSIVDVINEMTSHGGAASLSEARERFPNMSREAFDKAVLDAADRGDIQLMGYSNVPPSTPEEVGGMVFGGRVYDPIYQSVEPKYFVGAMRGRKATAAQYLRGDDLNVGRGGASLPAPGRRPPLASASMKAPVSGADLALQDLGQAQNLREYSQAFGLLAKASPKEAAKVAGKELLSAPRAILSSGDLSAPLRQGAVLTLSPRNAPQSLKAFGEMLRSLSPGQYDKITDDILSRAQQTGSLKSGLYLAGNKPATEEAFSSRFLQMIPGLKQFLGASERTYTTYLDSLRQGIFEKYQKNILKAGLAPEAEAKALRDAAKFINYASGRGTFGQTIDKAIEPLGAVLFAPRYVASRFNILNPVTYTRMNPVARKEALKDLVGFVSTVTATLGLARAAGAKVALDPRDTDFGKIRIGKRRYDIAAGFVQPIRTVARIADDLYSEGGQTPKIAGRFLRSKLSPVASLLYDYAQQQDYTGKPFKLDRALIERVTPLFEQDLYNAIREGGGHGAGVTLPGGLGVGVQDFDPPQTRPRRALPPPSYKPRRAAR